MEPANFHLLPTCGGRTIGGSPAPIPGCRPGLLKRKLGQILVDKSNLIAHEILAGDDSNEGQVKAARRLMKSVPAGIDDRSARRQWPLQRSAVDNALACGRRSCVQATCTSIGLAEATGSQRLQLLQRPAAHDRPAAPFEP